MAANGRSNRTNPTTPAHTLITLDTIAPAPDVVRIDGTAYDVLTLDGASLRERAKVQRLFKRVVALQEIAEPTDDDDREFSQRLRELAALLLPSAPGAVLERLNVGQIGDLVSEFFVRAATQGTRLEMAKNLSGLASSLGVNASTAEARTNGSTSQ